MEMKRTIVLLANTTQKQVWFGESAMRGATVRATRLLVEHLNGSVENGYIVSGSEQEDVFQIRTRAWCDDYDITRCHPVPSERVLQELEILKARGRDFRSGK
jgi:hypothetical protein